MSKAVEIQYHVANQNYAIVSFMVSTGAGAIGDSNALRKLNDTNAEIDRLAKESSNLLSNREDLDILKRIAQTNAQFKAKIGRSHPGDRHESGQSRSA